MKMVTRKTLRTMMLCAVLFMGMPCAMAAALELQIDSAAIETENKHALNENIIKRAVENAADDQNWSIRLVASHMYELKKIKSNSMALIYVKTTATGYSIVYGRSFGFNADLITKTIDDGYVSWVAKLNKEILSEAIGSDDDDMPELKELIALPRKWSI
jgi:hypothetical protein